jgi:hypothetical protein
MQDVLVPEAGYEGADLPMESSKAGRARSRVREVRDPGVFAEDGRAYLLYSIGGESGLAMAELIE